MDENGFITFQVSINYRGNRKELKEWFKFYVEEFEEKAHGDIGVNSIDLIEV